MNRIFKNRSLFQQFAISMIIVLFVPLITIIGFGYYQATNQISGLVSELEQKVVNDVSQRLDEMILNYDTMTLQLTNSPEVRGFVDLPADAYYQKIKFTNWIEMDTPYQSLLLISPLTQNFQIVGRSGIFYATDRFGSREQSLSRKESILQRAPLLEAQYAQNESTKVVASQLLRNGETGSFYISIGRVIFGSDIYMVKGVMFTDIILEDLFRAWQWNELKDGYFWIVDHQGHILYHPDKDIIGNKTDVTTLGHLLDNSNGSFQSSSDTGDNVNVYAKSEYSGWRIVATVPISTYETPIIQFRNSMWLLTFTILPFVLIAGYLFIRSILRPIHQLKSGMRDIEREQWRHIQGAMPGNEIGSLITGYNRMVDQISTLIETVYKAELQHYEDVIARQNAEFTTLQMQINPHFLYNTLGTIHNYAMLAKQGAIEEMIEALSSMLRYSVKELKDNVPFQLEIEHVNNYLLIQKHRQSTMPEVVWRTAGHEEWMVPRLILQPIIENVFQHAFSVLRADNRIEIVAEQGEDCFTVQIRDNGRGFFPAIAEDIFVDEFTDMRFGIGLRNVHKRLRMKFGHMYGVTIRGSDGNGAVVTLILPSIPRSESEQ